MKKSNRVVVWLALVWVVFISIFIILYFNCPCLKADISLLSIIISNSVVFVIFIITYCLIDKRNIRLYDNKRKVAFMLLNDTYDKCVENINLLDNKYIRNNTALKVNDKVPIGEEKTILQIHNYPFLNDNLVAQFATDGILSAEIFSDYNKVKNAHWRYIYNALAFFDYYNEHEWVQASLKELKESIDNARSNLGND